MPARVAGPERAIGESRSGSFNRLQERSDLRLNDRKGDGRLRHGAWRYGLLVYAGASACVLRLEAFGPHVMGVQVVQASRDVQGNVLAAVIPPQIPGDVTGQRCPQVATLQQKSPVLIQ